MERVGPDQHLPKGPINGGDREKGPGQLEQGDGKECFFCGQPVPFFGEDSGQQSERGQGDGGQDEEEHQPGEGENMIADKGSQHQKDGATNEGGIDGRGQNIADGDFDSMQGSFEDILQDKFDFVEEKGVGGAIKG